MVDCSPKILNDNSRNNSQVPSKFSKTSIDILSAYYMSYTMIHIFNAFPQFIDIGTIISAILYMKKLKS